VPAASASGEKIERLRQMRRTRPLAFVLVLGLAGIGPALARDPDDVPWESAGQSGPRKPATIEDILSRDLANTSDGADGALGTAPDQSDLFANRGGRQSAIDEDRLEPPRPPEVTPHAPEVPKPDAAPAAAQRHFEPAQSTPAPAQALKEPERPAAPAAATPPAAPTVPVPAAQPAAPAPAAPVTPAAAPASPATPAATATAPAVQDPNKLYLPLKRYFETRAAVALKDFDQADREALARFYDARLGEPLWTNKSGFNDAAQSVMSELKNADNWGLSASDYGIPVIPHVGTGDVNEDDLADGEIKLSLTAMRYAYEARGGRIDEPTTQLSSYLDRKPQLIERPKFLDALAAAPDKGKYLESLHPKHPQFERLRQKLIALRKQGGAEEFEKIPDGPKITPGKVHWQVDLVRRRLKVAMPSAKSDGAPMEEGYYDDELAKAVEQYKAKYNIEPVNTTITSALRKALNTDERVDERALLANMEQWRWMPADLGSTYITVNIPEFMVRVVKNGAVIHAERIVTGKFETQTPIFSDMMRTVVFQPSWNVPESIKVLELLPKLRAGDNPLAGRGLAIKRNGHDVDVWDVDWEKQDIRNFHIYQPPGDENVLGIVKFLFPNKHSVYLHDTPAKNLFNEKVRTFSHGCMRVRNPIQLAEVIMAEDKGWDKSKIQELITTGPEDNDIALQKPLPVHVTYFTAWVEDDGEIKTYADIYGHEQRVKLGLEGRWGEIVKNRDHLLPPEDAPVARSRDDWGEDDPPPARREPQQARERPARYTYRQEAPAYRAPPVYKKKSSFADFMNQIFGN
jgi:L,D-transpeptidase YcbB